MGGCQNYGPFCIPIIIRHLIFRVPKKGIIILTTTQMVVSQNMGSPRQTPKYDGPYFGWGPPEKYPEIEETLINPVSSIASSANLGLYAISAT